MARPNGPGERFAIALVVGLFANLAVAMLLAPIVTVGWCADAGEGGTSVCGSEQRSLLGAATPWWLWAGIQVAAIAATVIIARRRARA